MRGARMENACVTTKPTVFVVDDDEAVRNFLRALIESVGTPVETYRTAAEFLNAFDLTKPGCLVVDVRLPGMTGVDLQDRLRRMNATLPVIVITGFGEVAVAVEAMKRGAFDFFEKPFDSAAVLQRIQEAIELDARSREKQDRRTLIVERAKRLTPRERQVMNMVVSGLPNKAVAARLNVSPKTVEAHRANAMRKMEASSLPELVRLAEIVTDSTKTGPPS